MQRDDDPPPLDDDDQALISKLRALPPEGNEPDWRKLEAAIRAEVGDAAPAPWWRNWRWIVPIWALATTAAVTLIVTRDHAESRDERTATNQHVSKDAGVAREVRAPEIAVEPAPAVWLDGQPVDVDEVDEQALDGFDEPTLPSDEQAGAEMLPVTDLSWIDQLDERAMDGVEKWLAERKRS